jgi:pimeloyl-ACP methyl ester carboxylesterase
VKLYFDDASLDGQLQRSVGKSDSGMANVGECLAIAEKVDPGDRESWYDAWSDFAHHLVVRANEALQAGHTISARGSYLRAAEYFRQSFFFHREDLNGPRLQTSYRASVDAFRSALHLFEEETRILSGELSGYLFAPRDSANPRPTILHIGGYDGTAEELYGSVSPALARGYAFAAIDGPGQGALLYERHVPMRPDWENVVPAMFDALITHSEVDATRVILVGRSFGGVLAPRGASGEQRLAAMIVDPGQFDMGTTVTNRLGSLAEKIGDPSSDPEFDSLLEIPALNAFLAPRMTTHGVDSVRQYFSEIMRYTNADAASRVSCPTFVTDNETDEVSTGQGKELFDHLTCPRAFRLFTKAEGAEGHCEGMAPILFWDAAFDWLETQFPAWA